MIRDSNGHVIVRCNYRMKRQAFLKGKKLVDHLVNFFLLSI